MADIDDILNELGVTSDGKRPTRRLREPERPTKHTLDKRVSSFSPLPTMPSGQRRFGEDGKPIDEDPASAQVGRPRDGGVGSAVSDIYRPDNATDGTNSDLRDRLLGSGVVTPGAMTAAEQVIKQSPGQNLIQVLIEQGADEVAIQTVVAEIAGVPFERIDLAAGLDGGFDGRMIQRLGADFCKSHMIVPLRVDGSRAVIGTTRPDDVFTLDEIRARLGVPGVKVVLVTASDIRGVLEAMGESTTTAEDDNLSEILASVDETDVEVSKSLTAEAVDLEAKAGESPVIRYVNYIIQTAVKEGASDIHIEPGEKKLKIRFRIDGILFEMMHPPPSMSAAIVSRLKIMAELDISERRVPQDGRIRCTVQGRKLDLRMSTLPAGHGEKVVMRILDTKSINVELEQLGFDERTLDIWKVQIHQPHGIVLVTGPTGSGKTTTLYSSMRQLDKHKMNISTVEDPIEYHLDGITQTQVHERAGMTFAKALRALLRQDPDVIMLGEIRDHETAHIAVQAALTGHLVLSTLHTNDAPSSVTRLVNIGLEPFLVGAAVNAILAQRLLRRLCPQCKAKHVPSEEMAEFLEIQGLPNGEMWGPKGCDRCRNTGYSGRVGAYELLTVDDELRDVIARNPNVSEFRRLCLERGMQSLRQDGITKAMAGLTSIPEVIRITSSH